MASQHEQGKELRNKQPVPLRRQSNLRPVMEIYWSSIDPSDIRGAIDAVTRSGAAIILGRTSDGGALSVCILNGDQKIREYPHTVEDAKSLLRAVMDEFVGI
jgi:hypothetical protein